MAHLPTSLIGLVDQQIIDAEDISDLPVKNENPFHTVRSVTQAKA